MQYVYLINFIVNLHRNFVDKKNKQSYKKNGIWICNKNKNIFLKTIQATA